MRRADLFTIVCVTPVLCSLVWAIGHTRRNGTGDAKLLLDAERQRTIHSAMILFSGNDITGALPTPGRINRYTDYKYGHVPNSGPENWKKNSTGHLYSAMIAQRYLDTASVISPGEANPAVAEFGRKSADEFEAYNYLAYNPASDIYWMGDLSDPSNAAPGAPLQGGTNSIFRAKINRPASSGGIGHASYAHLMLNGQRRAMWSRRADHSVIVIGTRGPKNGATVGDEFDLSTTLLFFGTPDLWVGNICRGDGQIESIQVGAGGQFAVEGVSYDCAGETVVDNIFDQEFEACDDVLPEAHQQGDAVLAQNEIVTEDQGGGPKCLRYYDRP